jgi:hypothetical protein
MTGDQTLLFPDLHPVRHGSGRRRQPLILPKYLDGAARDIRLRDAAQDAAHVILRKWADMEASGRLRKLRETKLEASFLTDVFGHALGYTLFSQNLPQWQLQPKYSLPGGEADAAIGFFSANGSDPPRALVELKGPTVNLDRDRFKGRTAVQQLWDYLSAVPACPWGIASNYVSFRLYHRNKTPYAYELFTLQDLCEVDVFRQFYVLFERGGLLPLFAGQKPRADDLLERTETRQREVGSELYRDYHSNRVALIQHLRRKPHDKPLDGAIHVAQKLLDRIVFVAFCKDRQLLPSDVIKKAADQVSPFARVTNPRWRNFRDLFHSIDQGNKDAGITAYDGGLFIHDAEVDDLELEDPWTQFFTEIGGYDFKDEVNVDVLGHLFEQSVSDLEALRADPDNGGAAATPARTGRRRREGIYYTPAHITRYIVEHTVGTSLNQRFAALAAQFGIDPAAEPTKATLANWIKFQQARLDTLRGLRICDPACGSGAFLIQAYDYLENIYDEVITALCAHEGAADEALRQRISETILRENLFGVDLSAEAVEITQLALWIRTAQQGKTLADLSHNILCGNSIVDDPSVDPRAFDWPARFPQVFAAGKFDCVISNPPYVKLQNFRQREPRIAAHLVQRYRAAQTGNFDMYLPFIERGLDLLRPDGRMGFIAPNVWLFNEYGAGLRQLVAERRALARFVDFKSHQVFDDATTYTALQFFGGAPQEHIEAADASAGDLMNLRFYDVTYSGRGAAAWALLPDREQQILDTMRQHGIALAEATEQIFQGLITSADAVYHLIKLGRGRYYSRALEREVEIEDEVMKPLVSGQEAVPFATPPTDTYLLFPYLVSHDECRLFTSREMTRRFKHAWAYLRKSEERLRGREGGKMDHDEWYAYVYPKNLDKHERPKLLVPRLLLHLFAAGDPSGHVYLDNVDVGGVLVREGWDLHYLLGVLNSKACDFAWRLTSKPFRGEYRSANKQFIAPLPIPKTADQAPVADLARRLADLHGQRLEAVARVHRRFVTDLPPRELLQASPLPPALPGKLRDFHELPLGPLIDELEKFAKRSLKPAQRANWDEYLTTEIAGVTHTQREIRDLQAELDARVYALYGLSAEQIAVIEDAVATSG